MTTRQFQALPLPALTNILLVLGQMLLLIIAWSLFFVWSLLMTENLILPWLDTWLGPHTLFNAWASGRLAAYLLAFGLLMISVMLFFYRMPRAQDKIAVSLKFAVTILSFIVLHFLMTAFVMPQFTPCLPTFHTLSFAQTIDITTIEVCYQSATAIIFTVVSLGLLFWLQGTHTFERSLFLR